MQPGVISNDPQNTISNPHCAKKNVDRRDKRNDKRLHEIQEKLHTAEREIQSDIAEATTATTLTTSDLEVTKIQLEAEQRASSHLQTEHEELHEMVARLVEENQSLKEIIAQLEKELNTVDNMAYTEKQQLEDFIITTTSGKRYSNGVRELYYKLLTMHLGKLLR